VPVQARPAPGRGLDEDQADADVAVVGADELAGDPAERQLVLPHDFHVRSVTEPR
jgi:hypothetical protein